MCLHENGHSLIKDNDGQQNEHDPLEPAKSSCVAWSTVRSSSSYDKVKISVRTVVNGVLVGSTGFWSRNKYILASQILERKLLTWMKQQIAPEVVGVYWHCLRQAVKEALRFRRQLVVDAIERRFLGQYRRCDFSNILCSVDARDV